MGLRESALRILSHPTGGLWVVDSRHNQTADVNYFQVFKGRLGRGQPYKNREKKSYCQSSC